jgi:hypothetical protein
LQKAKEEKLLNKIMKLAGSQEDYEKWMAMLPLVDKERLRHEKEERTRLELLEKELKRLERAERYVVTDSLLLIYLRLQGWLGERKASTLKVRDPLRFYQGGVVTQMEKVIARAHRPRQPPFLNIVTSL